MKLNKKDLRSLADLLNACETFDGLIACTPVDAWTSGTGRFTKPRAEPPHCRAIDRTAATSDAAAEFFRTNPRRRRVIACNCGAISEALDDIVETPVNIELREDLRRILREMREAAA